MVLSLNSLPTFDGRGSGYWWLICVCKFWNSKKILESQWLSMIYDGLKGEAWHWFCLWRLKNFSATWSQFEIAFLHRYQSNFSSVLPDLDSSSSTMADLASTAVKLANPTREKLDHRSISFPTSPVPLQSASETSKQQFRTLTTQLEFPKFNLNLDREEEELDADSVQKPRNSKIRSSKINLENTDSPEIPHLDSEIRKIDLTVDGDIAEGVERSTVSSSEDDAEAGAITMEGLRTYAAFEDGGLIEKIGAATVTEGGLLARPWSRVALRKPPPLLAAIFPWDRAEAVLTGTAVDKRDGYVRRAFSLIPPPLLAAVLPWNREGEGRTKGVRNQCTPSLPPCELVQLGGWATGGATVTNEGQCKVASVVVGISSQMSASMAKRVVTGRGLLSLFSCSVNVLRMRRKERQLPLLLELGLPMSKVLA